MGSSFLILIIEIVLLAVITIFYRTDRAQKHLKAMGIEQLKNSTKRKRNMVIIMIAVFLILIIHDFSNNNRFSDINFFSSPIPFVAYLLILEIFWSKRVIKQKEQDNLEK